MDYASNTTEGQMMPFTAPLINAQEELAKLAERIATVAERLCGSTPPEPTMASPGSSARLSSVPNGVFADIADRGYDMGAKLDRIRRDVTRLERSLP